MYTRFWNLTWETNVKQKKLPSEKKLINFFNKNAEFAVFQFEKGAKKGKIHIQGTFTLIGKRTSKTNVLLLFNSTFKNVQGLTLTPTHSNIASVTYCTKEEGRVSGPHFCGKSEKFDPEVANMKLSDWQEKMFEALLSKEAEELRGRNVISVHDSVGKSGKSQFVKWLRVGQKKLVVRKLPVASVQQLNSAVYLITKELNVDVFVIDITRSLGKEQTFQDLFSALEDVVNGFTVDVMFGKYHETIFKPPLVLIFTNYEFKELYKYMSDDRWIPLQLGVDKKLMHLEHYQGKFVSVTDFKKINYTKKK